MNLKSWLVQTAELVLACLQEIFDESAYLRFLREHRLTASSDSYAEFLQERSAATARRPRCC
jgi:hypothetical protein